MSKMSNLEIAAKQALEALKLATPTNSAQALEQSNVIAALRAALAEPDGTAAQQSMQTIRKGFGRTMSYLTEVFGVSRQTLYNWLSGEKAPSPEYEGKIHQLEVASQRFMELGFKPSPSQLTRTLDQGKSFLELLAAGGDGATNADKLVKLVQRGQHSRARLEALLAEQQEPVTWMHTNAVGHVYFRKKPQDKVFNPQPLYTAPPQRKPLSNNKE